MNETTKEKTVQEIRKQQAVAQWYAEESFRCSFAGNMPGAMFWALMCRLTELGY